MYTSAIVLDRSKRLDYLLGNSLNNITDRAMA
jgi:hypothetical protein